MSFRHLTSSSPEHADRRLGAGLLVLLLAAVVAIALWQSTDSNSDSGSGRGGRSSRQPDSRVEARQLESFALLRTSPEGLPSLVVKSLGPPVHGMRWDLAQRLPLHLQGSFWLVPGKGYLCLVAQWEKPTAGRFCAETRYVLAHGLAGVFVHAPGAPWFGTPGKRLIVGVAPDDATKVVVYDHGSTSSTPVGPDGVFRLSDSIARPPRQIAAILRTREQKIGHRAASR